MFYGQCNDCGERWSLGTASTCTCPQPDRWVGLTDEEMNGLIDRASYMDETDCRLLLELAEAKLKEKNAA
jgi:hypothetical protein